MVLLLLVLLQSVLIPLCVLYLFCTHLNKKWPERKLVAHNDNWGCY